MNYKHRTLEELREILRDEVFKYAEGADYKDVRGYLGGFFPPDLSLAEVWFVDLMQVLFFIDNPAADGPSDLHAEGGFVQRVGVEVEDVWEWLNDLWLENPAMPPYREV